MRISPQTNQLLVASHHKKSKRFLSPLFCPFYHSIRRTFLSNAFCLGIFFLSSSAFAQTFPTDCPSKDLELVSATLPAPGNDPCACGGTRTLMLGINNKTGSTRTSFALWGTLVVRNSDGSIDLTKSGAIFACAGSIPKNAISILPSNKTISFTCGQSLSITGLHLAWTSASPNETCAVLEANPSLIAPKCGTLGSIQINTGVNGAFDITNATCTGNDGSIKVTPSGGGGAPYKVQLNATTERTGITTFTTYTGLAAGNYDVKIKDKNGCLIELDATVGGPAQLATPAAAVTQQPNCTIATGTVTCSAPSPLETGVTYTLKQGGVVKYTAASGIFSSVLPGTYELHADKGGCNEKGNNITVNDPPALPAAPSLCILQEVSLCGSATGTVRVISPTGAGYQYSKDNKVTWQTSTDFTNLAAGSNPTIWVKSPDGCVSATGTSCSSAQATCTSGARMRTDNSQTIQQQMTVQETAKVTAFPNPFNDRVKFVVTSSIAGKGSLEVYNMLGQKIKSVYQGQFIEGNQNFELSLPSSQRANLIYVLRVGDKRVTGKLLHLNR